MKTYLEMLDDLLNLVGLPLESISGQATPFSISEIDRTNDRILLDINGHIKSRPLEELRKIWEVMCEKPCAHVDSVLGGSGSSRSQPETILANLPYVEWLLVDGKKNIAYVGENTHSPGTLKRMDDERSNEYEALMHSPYPRNPLLPPEDEDGDDIATPDREHLLELGNKDFIFSCLEIMSRHRLYNGYTLPILESREQCALLFRHNNIHGILFRREPGITDEEFRAAIQDEGERTRYYTDTYSIGEHEYYVSSQWRGDKRDREAFLDWLFELLLTIRFETGFVSDFERNRIVFGAPGTGKSHRLNADRILLLSTCPNNFERVTFHPEYTYSQFVGSYKPITDEKGDIRYDFVPGPFMRVLVAALKSGRTDTPQPHLLLIEEINRAKVAAVFGDVFQLLDRDDSGASAYEIHATEDIKKYLISELGKATDIIRIPDNMFIWATMNSADQGVYPMDTAFKRRWNFEYIGIDENDAAVGGVVTLGCGANAREVNWNQLRRVINETLAVNYNVNEDKLIGPYFLSHRDFAFDEEGQMVDPERFIRAFKSKVLMYLYEDAAKPIRHQLFDGCDSSRYSSVCAAFDEKGIDIFGQAFVDLYNSLEV